MARPRKNIRPIPPICQSVIDLRAELGVTQQSFAESLGLTPVTIARYESGREPNSKSLGALSALARRTGKFGLAEIFENALFNSLGLSGPDGFVADETLREVAKHAHKLLPSPIASALSHRYYEKIGEIFWNDPLYKGGSKLGEAFDRLVTLRLRLEAGDVSGEAIKKEIDSTCEELADAMVLLGQKARDLAIT